MYILSLDTHFEDLKDNLSTTFSLSTDNMYITGALSKSLFHVLNFLFDWRHHDMNQGNFKSYRFHMAICKSL